MKIRILNFSIIILLTLSLTGCWDAIEISDQKIITLVGVDKINDQIKVLLEYQLPANISSEDKGSTQNPSKVLTGYGGDFTKARDSYLRRSNYDIFLGTVRALVFSNSFAQGGIDEYLYRLRGTSEYRRTITLFTTSTEIEELFDVKETKSDNVGFNIEHLSEQLQKNGILYNGTVSDILENACVPNTGYVLGNLVATNEEIEVAGYSVIKNNKKVGLIPSDKMKGVNYLLLKAPQGDYTVSLDGVTASLSTLLKKRRIEVLYDGENIAYNVKVSLDAQILYLSQMFNIDSEKTKLLEEKVSREIKKDITEAINTSQAEYECDYLYFYKAFRAKYNSDFKKMNWNDKYKDAQFDISVDVKIVPGNLVDFNKAR